MKALIQRVKSASVVVGGQVIAEIDSGLLVLLGVGHNDNKEQADKLVHKVLHYRIFADDDEKMNLDVQQVGGHVLVVSQFTIMANTRKGLRPSFSTAAVPKQANELYEYFIAQAKEHYATGSIAAGKFAADMQVSLVNDGPVTFMLEV